MLTIPAPRYTVRHSASVSAADTLIEIRNGSASILIALSAWVNAEQDETNVQLPFRLAHYDTQGATGTSLTIDAHQAGFATPASSAFYSPGTDPTSLLDTFDEEGGAIIGPGYQCDGYNEGWLVAPSNSLALELLVAPPGAVTLKFGIRFSELR